MFTHSIVVGGLNIMKTALIHKHIFNLDETDTHNLYNNTTNTTDIQKRRKDILVTTLTG